uniref:Coiled-coil serine rich protein 2 n=1 Tax=Oreochromis niloticus TaxID=8128 RepID=A0A669C6X6_ORENI
MEENAPIRSAMVSRLPKFGGRSSTSGTSAVSNGSAHPATPTQDGKVAPSATRPNGVIQASPFSLKLKRDEGVNPSSPSIPTAPEDESEDKAQTQLPSVIKEVKNGSPATPKMRRSGSLMVAVSSPKAIQKQSSKMTPKVGTKLGQSPMNGSSKTGSNSASIPTQTGLESRLVRPRLGSSSTRSNSQDSLSQSSESLKIVALDNMVRSNSFTHFKQIPSPTSEPMIRSFSFNRAVELAKPLANTQLRPPRSTFIKPPQLSNGRVGLGLHGSPGGSGGLGGVGGLQYNKTSSVASSLPGPLITTIPTTPRTLRKPLLPSSVLTKSMASSGGSLCYKFPRTGQAKQQKSLLAERGDNSEEFLDDFDSVGDVFSDGDLPDNRKAASDAQLDSLLNETSDWESVDLTGHKEESPMQESQGSLMLSPEQTDAPQISSVELSPSNSSGGTYMWDEEGLEPLGGPAAHRLDSYDDSELNSIDILNNLDPLATGELDDDDLMLDVDLPEDGLHETDRMSHIERPERANRQGQRRKHHRWSGSDHFHNDNRAHVLQHYDGFRASKNSARKEGREHGYMPMLDGLALEHMTQDCSFLKNQLLKLKTLLELEDTDAPADVPVESEDSTSATQLEVLVKEVQVLREELRSRDKIIAQLTLQCQELQQQHQQEQISATGQQVKCQCHHQRAPSSLRQSDRQVDKRMQHQYDKATQTYWRPPNHAPQILRPFNPCLNEHLHQGKLVKTTPTVGRSDLTRSKSEEATRLDADRPLKAVVADASGPTGPDKLSHLPNTNLHRLGSGAPQGITARDSPASAAQHERRAPAAILQNSVTPRSAGSTCPRMLQPPRFHKRVSLPALKPGATGGFGSLKPGCSLGPLANQAKQLPPPSRGLPCFNTGPQVQAQSLFCTSLLQPRRDPSYTSSSLEEHSLKEPNQGTLRPRVSQVPDPFESLMPPKAKDSLRT